jgi:hypothetical protein
MTPRRPRLVDGLRDGAGALGLPVLGEGIGEGLVRLSRGLGWLPGGRLAIPQYCPVRGCVNGTFSSLGTLRDHLEKRHPTMTARERTEACDTARILCRKAVAAAIAARPDRRGAR